MDWGAHAVGTEWGAAVAAAVCLSAVLSDRKGRHMDWGAQGRGQGVQLLLLLSVVGCAVRE